MGSGAFLVEACRALGERLVAGLARAGPRRGRRFPTDEDEPLHARRLVAQRCLYGVDKNPRAVDLAQTVALARDARARPRVHLPRSCAEMRRQPRRARREADRGACIGTCRSRACRCSASSSPTASPRRRKARAEIQSAPDDTTRADAGGQASCDRRRRRRRAHARRRGDLGLLRRGQAEGAGEAAGDDRELGGGKRGQVGRVAGAAAASLRTGEHPLSPFHWEVEFPEVFARENRGFDAIVGNPPFRGQEHASSASNRTATCRWLQTLHEGAHGNADLVAHFFRRAFGLLRQGGVFGLIATNTIGQGDTRETGSPRSLPTAAQSARATRRLKWPGEAAVSCQCRACSQGRQCAHPSSMAGRSTHLGLSRRR